MNFVIGDVHGEVTKLSCLLDYLHKVDSNATFIFVGDYIDKGENSKAVLALLVQFAVGPSNHVFLRGNHEYMWERALNGDKQAQDYLHKYGGRTTAEDLGVKSISAAADRLFSLGRKLFDQLINYIIVDDCFISHAGVDLTYADSSLEGIPVDAFLFNRYAFIASTRKFFGCRQAVFGHTGFYSPYRDAYKIGIDTAPAYIKSQPLTAYCTTNDRFYTSAGEAKVIPSKDVTSCPVIPRVHPYRTNPR